MMPTITYRDNKQRVKPASEMTDWERFYSIPAQPAKIKAQTAIEQGATVGGNVFTIGSGGLVLTHLTIDGAVACGAPVTTTAPAGAQTHCRICDNVVNGPIEFIQPRN